MANSPPVSPATRLKAVDARQAAWWAAIMVIVLAGLALRLTGVRFGLPYHVHPNEPMYYTFTTSLQRDGTFGNTHGDGYPPGFLALWIVEQKLIDLFAGRGTPAEADWVVARTINVVLDSAGVLFGALAARRLSGDGAGLSAGALLACQPALLEEARVAGPDAPFTAFALLSLWLLLAGRKPLHLGLLYGSLAAALASFITKYQSLPLVGLPFLAIVTSGWRQPLNTLKHLLIAGAITLCIAAWLQFVYDISQIHNIPYAYTTPLSLKEHPLAPISLGHNIRMLSAIMQPPFLLLTILGGSALGVVWPLENHPVDWPGAGFIALFCILFTLLMSLFQSVDLTYWRPAVAALSILWGTATGVVMTRIASVAQRGLERVRVPLAAAKVIALLPGATVVALLLLPLARASLQDARQLAGPQTPALLGDWFVDNVPQGARIAAERRSSYFNAYAGFPGPALYNAETVGTIFGRSIEAYRAEGIEYLIADGAASSDGGYLSDPQRPGYGDLVEAAADIPPKGRYAGTRLLVLSLPPIQQHVRYLWLGEAKPVGSHDLHPISFRGYDLPRTELQSGFVLEFTLYWMSVWPTGEDYVVEARLVDPVTDQTAALHESQPDRGFHPTSTWQGDMQFFIDKHLFALPGDIAPGVYDLQIALYDADAGERLPVTELDGESAGDSFSLGEITITP